MAYEGYLRIGGVEVVNTERARGYVETSDCPANWIVAPDCEGINAATGDDPYVFTNIESAPWYDRSLDSLSRRFMGVVGIRIEGVNDSTRSADRTEGIDAGGVIGRTRKGMRGVYVRVMLIGQGQDAVFYGMDWLAAVFDGGCGIHGGACGTSSAELFVACPPAPVQGSTEDYAGIVRPLRRVLHDTSVTSGPLVRDSSRSNDGRYYRLEVEFTITSERAYLYGETRELTLTPALPTIVQDTPYNLIPYPSAEIASGAVLVARNLATNPGVEVDATGWTGSATSVSGSPSPAAFVTSGRSTDIGAGGSLASFRQRLLGNNGSTAVSGATAAMTNAQEVAIPAGTGRRISITQWAAALILSGTSPTTRIITLVVSYEFFNGSTSLGAAQNFGLASSADLSGKAYSISGVAVPATATKVVIRTVATVTWTSSATAAQNSDIRLYSDALAVSVP